MPRNLQLRQMCKLIKTSLVWKNFKIKSVFITISSFFLKHSVWAAFFKTKRNGLDMFDFSYTLSFLPGLSGACKGQKDILQLLLTARSQQILKQAGHPSYQARKAASPPKKQRRKPELISRKCDSKTP